MTPGRGERVITALDIGSSKVSALIALASPEGELRVLGTGQRESRGVKRGFVADMEKTESAIREAIKEARTGDVVIIAGKGHETYQMIGNEKFHFDDREVAAEAIAAKEI